MEKKPMTSGMTKKELNWKLRTYVDLEWVDDLKRIFSCGASPNDFVFNGQTSLHYACGHGSPEIIRLILENGGDPNLQDKKGRTSFEIACKSRSEERVMALLESGKLELDCKYKRGGKYLSLAADLGSIDAVKFLVSKVDDIDQPDLDGYSALMKALIRHHDDCARYLIQAGANVNFVNALNNETPLILASRFHRNGIARELIKCGADVNAKNNHSMNALHFACGRSDPFESVEYAVELMRAGIDIDLICSERGKERTAFQLAARFLRPEDREYMGCVFLAYGAKNTARMPASIKFYSKLEAAAAAGLIDRCVQLIEEGHSLESSSSRQKNPIDLARSHGHEDAALAMAAAVNRKKILELLGQNASKELRPS